jgi:hypothetical protein
MQELKSLLKKNREKEMKNIRDQFDHLERHLKRA